MDAFLVNFLHDPDSEFSPLLDEDPFRMFFFDRRFLLDLFLRLDSESDVFEEGEVGGTTASCFILYCTRSILSVILFTTLGKNNVIGTISASI